MMTPARFACLPTRFSRLAAAFTGALALCLATALPATARDIKIATIGAANSPWDHGMRKFAEQAKALSGGELDVRVYTDAQLGDIGKMLSAMQLGTLEMGYFGLGSAVFMRGAEPLNILYAPYVFKSGEWAEKIANNAEFNQFYENIAKSAGVRVISAYGIRSPRALQTVSKPVNKPEDVKGLKLRVPAIPILKDTFETLGAQVVPLGMTEIYSALGRGMIDGQDNGFDLSVPLRFHEAAKFWSATDHAYELTGWFISEKLWQKLSAKERTALLEATKAGGAVTTELDKKLDQDSIGILKAAGVTYIEPDRAAFRQALANVYKKYEGKDWPAGLFDRIQQQQQ